MRRLRVLFFLIILNSGFVFAQSDDLRLGSYSVQRPSNGSMFDYSEPDKVNMKVSVWGYVRLPGKYIIPVNSSVSDLISYAGGPTSDALLEDIRLIKTLPDSTQQVITINYNELMFEPKIVNKMKSPVLQPGDILVLPGEPRFYFRDYVTLTLSIVSTLTSLAILILNIVRK